MIAEGTKDIEGAWQYQVTKLAEMGQVNRETEQIILSMLKDADEALQTVLENAIINGLKDAEKPLRDAAEKGLINGGVVPPMLAPNQMQAFQSYYRQSADHLNLVNTVMLESTRQAYQATVSDIVAKMEKTQSILNTATGEVVTGVTAMNSAVRSAVKKMVVNGITGYIDHAGRRWSPEGYVTMDIRTTVANAARDAVTERMNDYGSDLYQVSYHDGARPLCYPWQGKVISRTGQSGETEDGQGNKVRIYAESETSKGEPAGLFGINCGHYPIPFFPGYSRIRPPAQNEEENAKEYELSQKQRALERKLRNEKRDLAVLKAQGASEEEIAAQRERVRAADTKLDDFSSATGRARRKSREYTPIKPTFPDKDTYDPKLFDSSEKREINQFYRGGGTSSGSAIEYSGKEKNEGNYTSDIRRAVGSSVKTKNPSLIETLNRTSDKCTIDWVDGEGTAHYSYGTGRITMYTKKYGDPANMDDLMQTRWHEYFHFIDDAEASGSGYSVERNGYTFHGITAKARNNGAYARAAADDINAFFKRRGIDGVYQCVVDGDYRWIYKNGIPIDTNDFATCNELNTHLLDWLDEASGMKKAYRYLDDIGYPKSPEFKDYYETYFTPKRHTIKTREKFKGARDAFIKANEATDKARAEFAKTHDMDKVFREQRRLQEEAEAAKRMLAPVTDTFDGGALGAFMSPVCGGHSARYYGINDNGIREGVANIGSCLVTENEATIKGMNELCPSIYQLISNIIIGQNQ
jgi:hypothetical protein